MSRMIRMPGGALGVGLALGALTLASAPVEAQQVRPRLHQEREDCRCVDRDGNAIEKCTCFVMPDVEAIVTRAFSGRARLGVTLADDPDAPGARVSEVLEDGPADEAGIREGDLITRVDGQSLLEPLGPEVERSFDEDDSLPVQRLVALVREIEPGDRVTVEYVRAGERRTATVEARELDRWSFTVAPGDAPVLLRERLRRLPGQMGRLEGFHFEAPRGELGIWSDPAGRVRTFAPGEPAGRFFLRSDGEDGILRRCPDGSAGPTPLFVVSGACPGGLQLVALNPELAGYFGSADGVLVADVHEDSKLGLRPGDVILSVGDREATDPERVRRILASYGPDEEVTLRIMRQQREMGVQGTLGR